MRFSKQAQHHLMLYWKKKISPPKKSTKNDHKFFCYRLLFDIHTTRHKEGKVSVIRRRVVYIFIITTHLGLLRASVPRWQKSTRKNTTLVRGGGENNRYSPLIPHLRRKYLPRFTLFLVDFCHRGTEALSSTRWVVILRTFLTNNLVLSTDHVGWDYWQNGWN